MDIKLIQWQEYGETVMHPFAIGVTVLMAGGPATIYGPRAWAAYQEYAAD